MSKPKKEEKKVPIFDLTKFDYISRVTSLFMIAVTNVKLRNEGCFKMIDVKSYLFYLLS